MKKKYLAAASYHRADGALSKFKDNPLFTFINPVGAAIYQSQKNKAAKAAAESQLVMDENIAYNPDGTPIMATPPENTMVKKGLLIAGVVAGVAIFGIIVYKIAK